MGSYFIVSAHIIMPYLVVDFHKTWNAIGRDARQTLVRGSFEYLRLNCTHSGLHRFIFAMLLYILQNLIAQERNSAWRKLRQFIRDETLSVAGRNNAVWIVLGLAGHLQGRPEFRGLATDCIRMLLKNMTTGLQLEQAINLSQSFYANLDIDAVAKLPGIGVFALAGLYMPILWPIFCRQLKRLAGEQDGGLFKAVKILQGLLEFRGTQQVETEDPLESSGLVAYILQGARIGMGLDLAPYVNIGKGNQGQE